MKGIFFAVLLLCAGAAAAIDHDAALDASVAVEYIRTHDRNGDGKVSMDEYQDWGAVRAHAPHLEAGARAGFFEKDANRDGYLDKDEIKADLARHRAEIAAMQSSMRRPISIDVKPLDYDALGRAGMLPR